MHAVVALPNVFGEVDGYEIVQEKDEPGVRDRFQCEEQLAILDSVMRGVDVEVLLVSVLEQQTRELFVQRESLSARRQVALQADVRERATATTERRVHERM